MRLTRTLLAISITYLVLLLPLGTVQTIEIVVKSTNIVSPSTIALEQQMYIKYTKIFRLLKWIRALCFFVYQINFGINFFIYMLTNTRFRQAFLQNFPGLFPEWFEKRYKMEAQSTTLNNSMQQYEKSSTQKSERCKDLPEPMNASVFRIETISKNVEPLQIKAFSNIAFRKTL